MVSLAWSESGEFSQGLVSMPSSLHFLVAPESLMSDASELWRSVRDMMLETRRRPAMSVAEPREILS